MWPRRGQSMPRIWPVCAHDAVKVLLGCGQAVVRMWPRYDEGVPRMWPWCGQYVVKMWSICGQDVAKTLPSMEECGLGEAMM